MKAFRLFHAQIFISLINTVLVIVVLSSIFSENINGLLNQVEENVEDLVIQWEKEELSQAQSTVELEYRELEAEEFKLLRNLLGSEQFLSLIWKHQYLSLVPFLDDSSKRYQIEQLLYVNENGEVLAHSGQLTLFGLKLSEITPLDFDSKLVFSLDGVLLRIKKYPIINAFGDRLGSLMSITPYHSILKELNKFAHHANLGFLFLYKNTLVSSYDFPNKYQGFMTDQMNRYENFAIKCLPIQEIYNNEILLCVSKSIQLLLNLNNNVAKAFQSTKNSTIQNTIYLSFFIVVIVVLSLLLFYKLFIIPLNKIYHGFNQLGVHKKIPQIESSRIVEISQLNQSLNQIYLLFNEHLKLSLKLEEDAAHDALTQLVNRRYFKEQCERSLAEASRENKNISLLLIDIDKFKSINDLLGHDSGDILLCQISSRLKKQIRSYDLLARWGGDEFVLLVPNVEKEYYKELVDKIKDAFKWPFIIKGSSNYIDVSIGMSSFPENGSSLAELLVAADIAMYRAKEIPGTHALSFHDLDSDKIKRELMIEKELRQCVGNNELTLCFQPIFYVEKRKVSHAEALLRWKNPILGNVSPAEFIPIAERIGLIKDIGKWVRNAAFKQLQDWAINNNLKPKLTINISPIELNNKKFSQTFIKELSRFDIEPNQIIIEITESAIINDFALVSQLLQELADYDIKWALDDFGTGFTSLHYLTNLNPNYLKIDRTLIQDIEHSDRVKSLFGAIILLAHKLDITVISEGVETESQYVILKDEHCEYFQGYWGSKPIDSESFIDFFAKNSF